MNGLRSAKFDGNTAYLHNATGTALEILGDITLSVMVLSEDSGSLDYIVSYSDNDESEAGNSLYTLRRINGTQTLGWFTEFSTGSDAIFAFDGTTAPTLQLLTVVRENDVVTLYIDGVKVGSSSGTLTTPTGGTAGVLNIGAFHSTASSAFLGAIACVKIIDYALTAAQVYAEYQTTWADAPSSSSGGSSIDESQVALLSQVFGS